jgi:hypothetical protein
MLAIANQRVNVSLDDAEIRALLIGTGETFSEYPLRGSPLAFDLAPGAYRSRCWSCTQRGSRGASTGRAIVGGAGLEQTVKPGVLGHAFWRGRPKKEPVQTPEPRQRKKEADYEQEDEHMKGHTDPHRLKWGAWRAPVKHSIRRVSSVVKRVGEKSELSTTERGSTGYAVQQYITAVNLFLTRNSFTLCCIYQPQE